MKINQVAAQLYTCRDLLKTPEDISKTLKRIRQVGYTAVQVSGMGPIAEEELNKILAGEGLVCCATHENGDKILHETGWVIERLKKLNCKYTAYPYPAGIDFSSKESVFGLIPGLNRAGKLMKEAGQVLCYHNHQHEFQKIEGKTILDHFFDGTDPEYVQGEPDTYWVQYGGGDAVALCEKLKGRLPLIHLKDYYVNAENNPAYCEIGSGNLNFKKIIAAAEQSGCEWFIVEQDVCPGDPVESLEKSFRYIQENLVTA